MISALSGLTSLCGGKSCGKGNLLEKLLKALLGGGGGCCGSCPRSCCSGSSGCASRCAQSCRSIL